MCKQNNRETGSIEPKSLPLHTQTVPLKERCSARKALSRDPRSTPLYSPLKNPLKENQLVKRHSPVILRS